MTGQDALGPPHPLILTVALDPASQAQFDRLRTQLFPAAINYLQAHVTMFHHLPGEQLEAVTDRIRRECDEMAAAPFTVKGLRFLGRGTAYTLDMPEIAALRRRLAASWAPWLTAQDRQAWAPHVTVQNKVPPREAKQVFASLQATPMPAGGSTTGLRLWAYLGGPWKQLVYQNFR